MSIYVLTLLVYLVTDVLACWGLNLQFGQAGLYSFGFIVCQAAGAYCVAVLTMGKDLNGQKYILGMHLAFPLPILAACAVGGLVGLAFGMAALRKIRLDYQAIVMLVMAVIANYVVSGVPNLLNGSLGLAGIPLPLGSLTAAPIGGPGWGFMWIGVVALILSFWIVRSISVSPAGRAMRTARGNEAVARATGKHVTSLWLAALFWGGVLGGLSGAVLAMFIGAWSPSGWEYTETFVFLAALVIGGKGNLYGVALGALLVPVTFAESSTFLPSIPGAPNLGPDLEWIFIGLLLVSFLWFRPAGLLAERRRRYGTELAVNGKLAGQVALPVEEVVGSGQTATVDRTRNAARSGAWDRSDVPALQVDGVVVTFGGVRALDGISFTVPQGSITALVGPNGAGKSTLVGVLAGSIRAVSGRVMMFGEDVTAYKSEVLARRGLARTFQVNGVVDGLTIFENVMIGEARHGGEGILHALLGKWKWRVEESHVIAKTISRLGLVQLEEKADSVPSELSGGQQRLVELARCLVSTPKLILLDEPMAGVNPKMAGRLVEHIRRLRELGVTVLMAEHELDVVRDLADRVVLLSDGKTLAQGDTEVVFAKREEMEAYLGA